MAKDQWGGNWTELKLKAFEEYVKSYLDIMKKQQEKRKWPSIIIYFDGFAGSGSRDLKDINTDEELKLFTIETEIYKGSAERVLSLDKKFDEYYFVDINKKAIEKLENNLNSKELDLTKCKFINNDVNDELKELSDLLNKEKTALVLLDPFGMQIFWESLERFSGKRVDLWILLPSGVIINRVLDKKGEIKNIELLTRILGMGEDEIRSIFYKKVKTLTLLGEVETTEKINHSIDKIAELYIKNLKNIWKFVTDSPLVLLNSKTVPIYHFIFASNNKTALKIAKYIIEKKTKK